MDVLVLAAKGSNLLGSGTAIDDLAGVYKLSVADRSASVGGAALSIVATGLRWVLEAFVTVLDPSSASCALGFPTVTIIRLLRLAR